MSPPFYQIASGAFGGAAESLIPASTVETSYAFGALVWAIVLWLFEHEPETLQSSLRSSMTYLYHDSNTWSDLRTLFWHNK